MFSAQRFASRPRSEAEWDIVPEGDLPEWDRGLALQALWRWDGHFDKLSTSVDSAWEQRKLEASLPSPNTTCTLYVLTQISMSYLGRVSEGREGRSWTLLGSSINSKPRCAKCFTAERSKDGCIILVFVQDALLG